MTSESSDSRTKRSDAAAAQLRWDRLAVDILADAPAKWTSDEPEDSDEFLKFANEHRLLPLIQHKLQDSGTLEQWPSRIQDALLTATRSEAAFQMLRNRDVSRFVDGCRERQIEPIFFKGLALSHTVYPTPQTRPSVDVDFLVPAEQINESVAVLESIGYQRHAPYRGEMHSNEVVCRRQTREANIEFDCHLAINNRPLMARLLTYDELRAQAGQATSLDCLIPSKPHSLLLACLHRVAHHNTEDLLWLSDLSFLVQKMSHQERAEFCQLCQTKRTRLVCASGLDAAAATLKRADLKELSANLDPANALNEPTAVYLRSNRNAVGDAFVRWKSLDSTSKKLRYAWELVFPKREFLRWKYGRSDFYSYILNLRYVIQLIFGGLSHKKAQDTTDRASGKLNRQGPN